MPHTCLIVVAVHYNTLKSHFIKFKGDGTKPGLWTGLDSKMDWKTYEISLHEWAWLVTEVLLLVSTVIRGRAENKLCRRVNTPEKTYHEAAVRLHML